MKVVYSKVRSPDETSNRCLHALIQLPGNLILSHYDTFNAPNKVVVGLGGATE